MPDTNARKKCNGPVKALIISYKSGQSWQVMSGRAKVKVQSCQHWEQWLDSNLFVTLPQVYAQGARSTRVVLGCLGTVRPQGVHDGSQWPSRHKPSSKLGMTTCAAVRPSLISAWVTPRIPQRLTQERYQYYPSFFSPWHWFSMMGMAKCWRLAGKPSECGYSNQW